MVRIETVVYHAARKTVVYIFGKRKPVQVLVNTLIGIIKRLFFRIAGYHYAIPEEDRIDAIADERIIQYHVADIHISIIGKAVIKSIPQPVSPRFVWACFGFQLPEQTV